MADHVWKHTKLRNLRGYSHDELLTMENGRRGFPPSSITPSPSTTDETLLLLPFETVREFLASAGKTTPWICEGFLAAGELTDVYGAAKDAGKTTLLTHLVAAVVSGEPFLGEFPTKQERVLFLSEMGPNLREILQDAGIGEDEDRLLILSHHKVAHLPWQDVARGVCEFAKENDYKVVLVDTFAEWAQIYGAAENEAGTIREMLAPLKRLTREYGLATVYVRQANWEGKARGSTQLNAEPDMIWELSIPAGDAPSNQRQLSGKGRHREVHGKKHLIALSDSSYIRVGITAIATQRAKAWSLFLKAAPKSRDQALTHPQMVERVPALADVSESARLRVLTELTEEKGILAREKAKGAGNPWVYWNPEPRLILDEPEGTEGVSSVVEGEGGEDDGGNQKLLDLQEKLPDDTPQPPEAADGNEAPTFTHVADGGDLRIAVDWIRSTDRLGIDLETTGLDPERDRIALLQLSDGETTYVLDALSLDLDETVKLLVGKRLVAHNAGFEERFLKAAYGVDLKIDDTLLMAQVLEQGDHPSMHTESYALEAVCERYLSVTIDKSEQTSDWSARPLTEDQLAYAAEDARVLPDLHECLQQAIVERGLDEILDIERRADPAFRWMEETGVYVDAETLKTYIADLEEQAENLRARLKESADINWNSGPQLIEFFGLEDKEKWPKTGKGIPSTKTDHLRRLKHPAVKPLLELKKLQKNLSTYGEKWIARIADDGRIHPKFLTMGAVTGRTACTNPNLQNIPHGTPHRAAIMAPEGRVLIKADYSQIELRIAAKYAPDDTLLRLYRSSNVDVHTKMAAMITGKPEGEITKAERAAAKAANFGPLYGAGAKTLRDTARKAPYFVEWSLDEVKRILKTFKETYPGIAAWHNTGYKPHETNRSELAPTRTLAGRRRRYFKSVMDWFNTPIQGTGADGAKLAMALLYERRSEVPSMAPVLFVHDEIVVECDQEDAAAASELLRRCMQEGMDAVLNKDEPHVPVVVDVEAPRKSWG